MPTITTITPRAAVLHSDWRGPRIAYVTVMEVDGKRVDVREWYHDDKLVRVDSVPSESR